MPWDTGLHQVDAETDFQRARRRQALAALSGRLRREPDDINLILPFDEVVRALGRKGERSLGLQTIALASIVGTVDRARDFDRRFRPRSNRMRERWQGIDMALRRGRGRVRCTRRIPSSAAGASSDSAPAPKAAGVNTVIWPPARAKRTAARTSAAQGGLPSSQPSAAAWSTSPS